MKKEKRYILFLVSVLLISASIILVACGTDKNGEEINEEMALSMAQKFCADMTESWLKLERKDMSDYLIDNLDTHLVLKWIDFEIADRLQNSWRQLVSIDSVELANGKFKKISEKQAIYETFAEIKYTRYEPSVNGIGIDLTLRFEEIEGTWMITGIDLVGASIYREWKDNCYPTIEEMDQAFEESCKARGISI